MFLVYKSELEKDIQGDTSGDFKRLLTALVTGNREERPTADIELAKEEANELYKVRFYCVLPPFLYLTILLIINKVPLVFFSYVKICFVIILTYALISIYPANMFVLILSNDSY